MSFAAMESRERTGVSKSQGVASPEADHAMEDAPERLTRMFDEKTTDT